MTDTHTLQRYQLALDSLGIQSFSCLCERVAAIPYGRVGDPSNPLAVLDDNRGTCSSKHALLARMARFLGHGDISLQVGLYRMHEGNTPGIGHVLESNGLEWIPEAHCYLVREGRRLDFTGLAAGHSSPFDDLLEERTVDVESLEYEKPAWHRAFMSSWASAHNLTFEQAWVIRESCISALSSKKPDSKSNRHNVD